jgi:ABC-type sugar transport system permease subunit
VDKIPADYYDAARIAGASRPQIFFQVVIPLIWDVLVIAVVLWIVISIKMFEFMFAFNGGLVAPMEIWTNALYMFMLTFGQRVAIYRMGYGTAVAVTMLVMVIVFSGVVRLLMRREKVEY